MKFGTVTESQLYSISKRVKAMNNGGNQEMELDKYMNSQFIPFTFILSSTVCL